MKEEIYSVVSIFFARHIDIRCDLEENLAKKTRDTT
jgi:hypothetical protein